MPAGSRNNRLPMLCHQRGQALIAITALLGITLLVTVYAMTQSVNQTAIENQKTIDALAQAKAALIGYAASVASPLGALPCPDTDNDGNSNPPSGGPCIALLGRLPWKTLGLTDLRDSSGERLWYALSAAFQNGSSSITSSTLGQLAVVDSISGAPKATGIIAIVFSPGPALGGQTRDTSAQNTVTNYLDGENADSDNIYATGPGSDIFNDTILAIAPRDLFAVVDKNIFAQIVGNSSPSAGLTWYFENNGSKYPWPANAGSDGESVTATPPTLSGLVPYSDLNLNSSPWHPGWLDSSTTDYAVNDSQSSVTIHFLASDSSILTTCTIDSSGSVCR